MIVEYRADHASIQQFNPIDIPDFTVLTGVNGSGKSHLLEAIKLKKVVVRGLENANIVLFNYENFRLENEPSFTGHQLSAERESAWQFYQGHFKNNAQSWRNQLGDNYIGIRDKAKTDKKSFWTSGGETIRDYVNQFKAFVKSDQFKGNNQAQGIYSLAKKLPYSIDEIEREEFVDKYVPFTFKNDFLPMQLGRIFWDYYIKYRSNQVNKFENESNAKSYPALSESEFIAQHGEKPWVVANRILRSFDTLTYEFESPEGRDFFGSYQLELRHTMKPELKVEFDKLSSGERILMALVASIYKASSDKIFPELLLLDEVDASLHPSMMRNMLNVIKDIFLPEGVKVILVTHSPTTIALAPDESIYVMNSGGFNRIEKRSQKDALSILTQGYATIDEGLKFFDEVSKSNVTIVSEGYNTKFIQKALELYGISGVEVLEGIEGSSGKNQLKTLFEFFSRIDHKNNVIFVFDCDVGYSLCENGCTYPFIFTKNESNDIAKKGIENLFDPSLFSGFISEISHPDGTGRQEFYQHSKKSFQDFILARNQKEDFVNFQELIDKVSYISKLGSGTKRPQLEST